MKISKIVMISLLLLVLTIGVVSADDNITQDVTEPLGNPVSDDCPEVLSDDVEYDDDFPSEIIISMPQRNYTQGEVVYFSTTINNGKMDVSVDGNPKEYGPLEDADEVSHAFYINSTDLSVGSHILSVKITGDSKYADASKDFEFFIENMIVKVPGTVVINNHPHMSIELPYDATGNVEIFVNGEKIYSEKAKQYVYQEITDYLNLSKKDNINEVRVVYTGDGKYDAYNKTFNVSASYDIEATNRNVDYGEPDKYYYFVLVDNISIDKIIATIDGERYDVLWDAGYCYKIYISNLTGGRHNVTISYGDEKYYQNSVSRTIDVTPRIILNIEKHLYDANNTVYLRLPKDADGNLSLFVDGKLFESKKLVDGTAVISISKLKPGFHNVYAFFDGNYNVVSLNNTFAIGIDWNVDDCNISQNPVCTFTVPDTLNGMIIVSFDGKNYTHACNGNFEIVLSKASKADRHQIWMYYIENDAVLCSEHDVLIVYPEYSIPYKVTKGKGSIVVRAPNPKANVTVTAHSSKDKYKLFAKVVDGKATVSLDKLSAGNYVLNIFYEAADDVYFSKYSMIKVENAKLTANDLTKYYGSSTGFKVKVTNYKGKTVKYQYVKFYINGKYVKKVKTNKYGYATLKIGKAPGSYKITAKYDKVEITRKLTVKHSVTLKTATVKKSAKKLVLKATLKTGKKALKYKKVTFKFNGKKYTARTNKYGVAKVTIKKSVLNKLKVGKYVRYQATYLKDTVGKSTIVKK